MGNTDNHGGITRRDFVKGLAASAAGIGLITLLPGGILTSAGADATASGESTVGKKGDGIYIEGIART